MDPIRQFIRVIIGSAAASGALTTFAWAESVGWERIEPLVTHQTIAVAHLRLKQVDLEHWHQLLMADDADQTIRSDPFSTPIGRLVQVLKDHAVEDAFFFFAIGTGDLEATHAAIGMDESVADTSGLQQALHKTTGFTSFRRDGRLIVLTRTEDNLPADAALTSRPDLWKALSSFPEADVVFALALSRVQRQAIALAELQLPTQFGGGPLSSRINDLQWLACALDADDRSTLRVTLQATDDAAANRLEGWAASLRDLAKQSAAK